MAYENDPRNPQTADEHSRVAKIMSAIDGISTARALDLITYVQRYVRDYEREIKSRMDREITFSQNRNPAE